MYGKPVKRFEHTSTYCINESGIHAAMTQSDLDSLFGDYFDSRENRKTW
jgi:hypothetical protein